MPKWRVIRYRRDESLANCVIHVNSAENINNCSSIVAWGTIIVNYSTVRGNLTRYKRPVNHMGRKNVSKRGSDGMDHLIAISTDNGFRLISLASVKSGRHVIFEPLR